VNAGSPIDPLAPDARRLARDVHDVLGHHLSAIVVHADLARRRLAEGDGAAADESLELVREAAAAALAQTRSWIGLAPAPSPPPLATRLEELALAARAAGLTVDVRERGERAVLRPQVRECVERIVQESLTNVLRHARATRVEVDVRYRAAGVQLTIVNDGRARRDGPIGSGSGVAGMRERAVEAGGRLLAGPGVHGGWRVSARLPR